MCGWGVVEQFFDGVIFGFGQFGQLGLDFGDWLVFGDDGLLFFCGMDQGVQFVC